MAKTMSERIPCIVFKRELPVACPDLPAFLSKAGGQSHDVHSKETKAQLMLALNQLFVSLKRRCAAAPSAVSAPTWDRVVKDTIAMKPHFAECAEEASKFAKEWSGGDGWTGSSRGGGLCKAVEGSKGTSERPTRFTRGCQIKKSTNMAYFLLEGLVVCP